MARGTQFAEDSPLEEDGFEPPVPPGSNTSVSTGFASWRGGRSLFRKGPVLGGDRQFESAFLRRRVRLREFRDRGGRDQERRGCSAFPSPERSPIPHRGGLAPRQIRRVLDYIDAHLTDELGLVELAAIAELSPHHFGEAFKTSMGTSPHSIRYRKTRPPGCDSKALARTPGIDPHSRSRQTARRAGAARDAGRILRKRARRRREIHIGKFGSNIPDQLKGPRNKSATKASSSLGEANLIVSQKTGV